MSLAPPDQFSEWLEHGYDETFTAAQRTAIAAYLDALPRLIDLEEDDATAVARALKRYWAQFLSR